MALLLILLMWLVTWQVRLSDEMQAFNPKCLAEEQFNCFSGDCVPREKKCDGKRDCKDGSDEDFCVTPVPEVVCNETHQFMCADGLDCLPSSSVCNSKIECDDGSDEVDCNFPAEHDNSTCKGFLCDNGTRCISKVWTCDARYDCEDKSDEDIKTTCHHERSTLYDYKGKSDCENKTTNHLCLDGSYCLLEVHMCDGMKDCRDGSDEGKFCEHWHTMCTNSSCPKNSRCKPQRSGETTCLCKSFGDYNKTTNKCHESDDCALEKPICSHRCITTYPGFYTCGCQEGYIADEHNYLCFAPDPEALLFFSTMEDIRYVKVKSKEQVVVATGLKSPHGVFYDGNYLYWVETEEGHQAIMRAQLHNVAETKQVIAALGVEDPGDIAVDPLGDNIYFSDTQRHIISVCRTDGSVCLTLPANTSYPKHVTLDPEKGIMYWADWKNKSVIMTAKMDGSNSTILVDNITSVTTGLALDAPNNRLYFIDGNIKVIKLDSKKIYSLFSEPFHYPYAISVFENTLYWVDWTSRTLQKVDKIHPTNRNVLLKLDQPVLGLQIYHPILMKYKNNPCGPFQCLICLLTSNETVVCSCPDHMTKMGGSCETNPDYRPQYIVVGVDSQFTRIRPGIIGNPETHTTHMDLTSVTVMAYDSRRDFLYMYDTTRQSINSINMSEFTLGVTRPLAYGWFVDVFDMDYDPMTDSLYILDAGRHLIEVISLKTNRSAIIYHFPLEDVPVSFCLLPDYGKMLVAVFEKEDKSYVHINFIGMDGQYKEKVILDNIYGPFVHMRYSAEMNLVYITDEGFSHILTMHPEGNGGEVFRDVLTSIASMAVTDTQVFWTDRRSTKLYWANIHEAGHKIRRIELTMFPKHISHLNVIATKPPPKASALACPCEHVCVQTRNWGIGNFGAAGNSNFSCICSPGYKMVNGECSEVIQCKDDELYCHRSNECFKASKKCDGFKDCKYGEDEEYCIHNATESPSICRSDQTVCYGRCISRNITCDLNATLSRTCSESEFACKSHGVCVSRTLACDGHADCPDGFDESPAACDTATCFGTEFMCGSGNCIPITWHCDGGEDCADGSDEVNCNSTQCPEHMFQCRNSTCIDLSKQCDGKYDCVHHDDEDDCDTSEFVHVSVDCPGGSDEDGCDKPCRKDEIPCINQNFCLKTKFFCDGTKHCWDGYDESDEGCARDNPCTHATCPHGCRVSPRGPLCLCGPGYAPEYAVPGGCHNVDECGMEPCAHACRDLPGSFVCSCHVGYALRSDRRSCKALHGRLSVLFTKTSSVWSMTSHIHHLRYQVKDNQEISDIDVDVRREKMYAVLNQTGKLIEVNLVDKNLSVVEVTNIGMPSKVSVEWVTGNVYLYDGRGRMRVCDFRKRRCATILRLPSAAQVNSMVVDPEDYRLFYCISEESESIVRSASLMGKSVSDLVSITCSGLAADSFSRILYIASGQNIMKMNYDGSMRKTIVTGNPVVQSPHHLALFENHLYFLSSTNLTRCLLFSSRGCSSYSHLSNSTGFVIHHESAQRNDIYNDCAKKICSYVCVLDRSGPKCICHDGGVENRGKCPPVASSERNCPACPQLEHFSDTSEEQTIGWMVLWIVLVVLLCVTCVGLLVQQVFKKNPDFGFEPTFRYFSDLYHRRSSGRIPVVQNPEEPSTELEEQRQQIEMLSSNTGSPEAGPSVR
ncbi:unnamed protein product [Euphydryas editha]|uniref:EGF-like domain-containing protein n=1 Tax=Euphydryas editha TaxID=104508 RepID=A0AAU9UE91_EUPED|nr:unnamed protein product [Euphydryas editha]